MTVSPQLLTDTHCHLDFAVFDCQLTKVLERAIKQGVHRFMIPGSQAACWQKQIEIANRWPECAIALGLHPWFINDKLDTELVLLTHLLEQHSQVVAVGESGLDQCIGIPMEQQEKAFLAQLELACAMKKPLILHQRKTAQILLSHLKRFPFGGVLHGFSGSVQLASCFIHKGFHLGIGGVITYERAAKTRNALTQLPLNTLLLETDSPDCPISGFQGKTNTPAKLPLVFHALCHLRSEPAELIQAQLEINASHFLQGKVGFASLL